MWAVALTQRARPRDARRTLQDDGAATTTTKRLPLRLRAARLLRGAAGLRARAAARLCPTSTQSCGTTDADRQCGTCTTPETVGRPPAREPRKERTALLLDAGRRTKLEGFGRCARDVAVGHGRRATRHETIGRSRGTKVARAPRSLARVTTTGASRDCEGFDRPTVAVVRRRGRPPKTAGQ